MRPALLSPEEFVGIAGVAHLCTGGEAPILQSHLKALARFAADKGDGMAGRERMFDVYRSAKRRLSDLVGRPASDIALLGSAPAGVKVVAPALARSQAAGSVIQGIGYALYEAREIDGATGDVLSGGMEVYRIPGISAPPERVVHFDEGGSGHGPGGRVGIGEAATGPTVLAMAASRFCNVGWQGRNGRRGNATPSGPIPGPPPPCGMQNVLCKFRWQTSAPMSPGRQSPTCAFMFAPSM